MSQRNFAYDNVRGIATVTTTSAHGLAGGDVVMLKDILLECEDGSKIYPTEFSVPIPQYLDSTINNVSNTIKNALNNPFDIIIDIHNKRIYSSRYIHSC